MDFKNLGMTGPVLKALTEAGYAAPTEIQAKAIPPVLAGEDIIGCAQTGTGKTGAFAIPLLQRLAERTSGPRFIRALVLTPTRELAIQIDENFKLYGKYLGLKTLCIFGGVSQNAQTQSLKGGIDILTATPGRLLDLIQQKYVDISRVEIFVLDEADRMLDMGFVNDVKKVHSYLKNKKQTLFFSATLPDRALKLAATMVKNPKRVQVSPVSSTAEQITQGIYLVNKQEKSKLLVRILEEKTDSRSLVFTKTRHGADRLARQLGKSGIAAVAIHGSKSQNARVRALEEFKSSKVRVLIATDIAARGIDIEALPFVVNFELPDVPETYVHRIGRTGRAGMAGEAISFYAPGEDDDNLSGIQKLIGFEIPVRDLNLN
ncbi:MAG: DEAD/DEAH box helicase [Leadbetterella sp.]|nr:DEAD/DEAH box helicase [Leadbetterella sp.]